MFTSYLLWSFCWLIMWYYIHACTNALFIVISMILTIKKIMESWFYFVFFFVQSLTKRIWMSKFLVTLWHIYLIFELYKKCLKNINAPWCKIQKRCIQWIIQSLVATAVPSLVILPMGFLSKKYCPINIFWPLCWKFAKLGTVNACREWCPDHMVKGQGPIAGLSTNVVCPISFDSFVWKWLNLYSGWP